MKKFLSLLIAVVLCAIALPSPSVASSQNTTPLPAAKLRRLKKAIAGRYIVVFRNDLARSIPQ